MKHIRRAIKNLTIWHLFILAGLLAAIFTWSRYNAEIRRIESEMENHQYGDLYRQLHIVVIKNQYQ